MLSWLHASASDSIKKSILYHSSSREVWIQLEKRFSISNGALKYKINKQLYDTKQWGMPIKSYEASAMMRKGKQIAVGSTCNSNKKSYSETKYGFPKGHPNSREGQRGYRKEGGNLNSKGGRFKHGNKKAAYNVALSEGGDVRLKNSLLLKVVLYVPNFKHNLLSFNKLVKRDKCEVVFYPDVCKIQDSASKIVKGVGRAFNGLYYLIDMPLNEAKKTAIRRDSRDENAPSQTETVATQLHDEMCTQQEHETVRRSGRKKKQPSWLQDYVLVDKRKESDNAPEYAASVVTIN
ncbi:Retrovirus-related Pol polyprotein from transposon RE2, partial [Bienertia sinuspersici]